MKQLTYPHTPESAKSGFTIVELLIVIVVIAILAAITIVSYGGIQSRATNVAVQSDISNIAQKMQLYYTDKGSYPDANSEAEVMAALEGFKASRSSYVTSGTNVNLAYCTNAPTRSQFAIIGWSKGSSTKGFYITSNDGVRDFNYAIATGGTICSNAGISATQSWMWLYDVNTSGGWRTFI